MAYIIIIAIILMFVSSIFYALMSIKQMMNKNYKMALLWAILVILMLFVARIWIQFIQFLASD